MENHLRPGQYRPVTGAGLASRVLCRLEEIKDGEGRGFLLGAGSSEMAIFVVREDCAVYGYVNSCPHLGTPLDFRPDGFMSPDGTYILCSTHGALFRIEDGHCVSGPCAGQGLTHVNVMVDGQGYVRLVEPCFPGTIRK